MPRRLTRQQAALSASYHVGDEVVFHRDAYGCRKDDVCLVRKIGDDVIVLDLGDGRERRFRPSGNAARNLGVYETAANRDPAPETGSAGPATSRAGADGVRTPTW